MSPTEHAPGLWTFTAPQRFMGVEVGARMTVMATSQGLVVHSPLAIPLEAAAALGDLRYVVSPNKLHHLYARPWIDAGLEAYAAPGLPQKRPDLKFTAELTDPDARPFGPDISIHPLACFPFTNEVVLLHRPTRTLVVTDLVFHFSADAPWHTRAAMFCLGGYPGCRTTLLERVGFRRSVARAEIGALLELDFDRLIMAHGEVIETGGKEALRGAMGWLGL